MDAGFWDEKHKPIVGSFLDETERRKFADGLKAAEAIADTVAYRGESACKVCGCANGNAEHSLAGWTWPSGLLHYVEEHATRPSDEFVSFVTAAVDGEPLLDRIVLVVDEGDVLRVHAYHYKRLLTGDERTLVLQGESAADGSPWLIVDGRRVGSIDRLVAIVSEQAASRAKHVFVSPEWMDAADGSKLELFSIDSRVFKNKYNIEARSLSLEDDV